VSGGPRGERPSRILLRVIYAYEHKIPHKIQNKRTHALTHANMGNTKYEHVVVTAHQVNGEEVTKDTQLPNFDEYIVNPSTFTSRANDFNNTLLTTVDDFFFPELFEFELEPSSQKSDQSNFSPNNVTK